MKKPFDKISLKAWSEASKKREIDRKSSPAAPQESEVAVYRKFLKKITDQKKNLKMLVLGVTPELRDLGIEFGYEVLAADFNVDMLKSMTEIMKHKNHPGDLIMKCDWFKMDKFIKEGIFDVALSDGSFNNIQPKEYKKLFLVVKKLLKPGGYLIDRRLSVNFSRTKPIKYFEKEYTEKKAGWVDFQQGVYLGSHYNIIWYNPKTKLLTLKKFYSWARTRAKDKKLSLPLREVYKKIANKERGGCHTIFSDDEFERMAKKHFKIIKIERPADFGFMPIYLLKKK